MVRSLSVFLLSVLLSLNVAGQEFNEVPKAWKWVSDDVVAFTYDGSFTDSTAFSVNARSGARNQKQEFQRGCAGLHTRAGH